MEKRQWWQLRRKAEKQKDQSAQKAPAPTEGETQILTDQQSLIEELRIHQIELEIQNEELRNAQKDLEESRDRYLNLFHHAPVAYVTLDANGIIRTFNRTFSSMIYGRPLARAGQAFADLLVKEDADQFRARFPAMLHGEGGKEMEARLAGEMFPETFLLIKTMASPAKKNEEESKSELLLTATDITDRRRAEEKVRDSELFQRTLFEAIPAPVFFRDREGQYQGVNRAFEEFSGYDRSDLFGKTVYDVWPLKQATMHAAKDRELIVHGGEIIYEAEMTTRNSEVRTVLVHKAAYTNANNQIAGLIGAIMDRTENRRIEAERESLIKRLKASLEQVDLLSGLLPICMHCKKIRDDEDSWQAVETYIRDHSEVEFSHSVCPDCLKHHYPQYTSASSAHGAGSSGGEGAGGPAA